MKGRGREGGSPISLGHPWSQSGTQEQGQVCRAHVPEAVLPGRGNACCSALAGGPGAAGEPSLTPGTLL